MERFRNSIRKMFVQKSLALKKYFGRKKSQTRFLLFMC